MRYDCLLKFHDLGRFVRGFRNGNDGCYRWNIRVPDGVLALQPDLHSRYTLDRIVKILAGESISGMVDRDAV